MAFVLGVDGGGSKTHALLLETGGRALGFGQSGPSNHQVVGLRRAMGEVQQAVESTLLAASLSPQEIQLGYFCLAGADLPEDYAKLQEAVGALKLAQKVVIKNDTLAALRAGLQNSWGVVVICGAGFNAAGRAPDGQEIVLPGLGPMSGDWGGGGTLSQEMIRLVMRAADGRGAPTLLTSLILEALQVASVEGLLSKLYKRQIRDRQILDLVPLLFDAAEAGDVPARDLIRQMGTEVGITAGAIIRRLSIEKEDVEIVLGGSVFKGTGTLLLDTASDVVHQVAPNARIVLPAYEPVVGAALLALEATGVVVSQQHHDVLRETLPAELILGRIETNA